jgi:hypothetical protein
MSQAITLASSHASIHTPKAQGYLIQLCKHFAHKIPATFAENRGRIEFGAGVRDLDADNPAVLVATVTTGDETQLATLEDVVERHLRRFAFKDELSVQWVRDR